MWQQFLDHQVYGNEILIDGANDRTQLFLSLATRSSECFTFDSEIDWDKRHNNVKASNGFRSIGEDNIYSTSSSSGRNRNSTRISSLSEERILVFSLNVIQNLMFDFL
jgi:hypothetical protein